MLSTLLASLLLTAAPAPDITFDHILVLPPTRGGTRTPFRADPILADIALGHWPHPAEHDRVGSREWTQIAPDKDGLFENEALAGGYAYATFSSPEDAIMILEASGHVMVYADGEPRTGDPYENGSVRLPIRVHKGENSLLFLAGRGHLRAKLSLPPAAVFVSPADATLPDMVEGESASKLLGAVVVVNTTDGWLNDLTVISYGPDSTNPRASIAPLIPPMSIRKVPVSLAPQPQVKAGETTFEFAIEGKLGSGARLTPFHTRVRKPDQTRKITFRSDIDGSVQYFGYNPPKPDGESKADPALILSLHGASVEAAHQAECYSMKPWAALAAPTNRREFGFDWEDWGRLDALEVLSIATGMTHPDPSRIYLTGHSMGGHGTWLIGATYPGKFAAIAPSAGWTTFWSYGGAEHFDKDPTPIDLIFRKAMNPGDTIGLAHNLINDGVYILHGDVDDNVPVTQARSMRKLLAEFHPDFAYHEQPGANHWWGNECMDWPPLMEFLKQHTIPRAKNVTHIKFTTANPAVSSSCYWATIAQQQTQGDFSSIDLTLEGAAIKGKTTNVACLCLDLSALPHDKPMTIELDGEKVESLGRTKDQKVFLLHGEKWADGVPASSDKSERRTGPFKHAFNHHALLVYGTKGTPAETAFSLAKARYDAETIYYRGNGCFDIIADTDFTPAAYPDRSVILYGNADTNAAWSSLLKDSPIDVHEGSCRLADHEYKGDTYAALFTRPRADSSDALIGAVAFTGLPGAYATQRIPYFSSGVAFPDWTIFSTKVLSGGMRGIEAAGYFNNTWSFDEAQTAFAAP